MKKKIIILSTVFLILLVAIFYNFNSPISPQFPSFPLSPIVNSRSYFPSFPKTQPQTTFVAVGDIMLGRYVNVKMLQYKDFRYPFLKTADILSSADITFGNLESPIVAKCPTTSVGMIFCGRPEAIEGLKFAGFDVLSLANNHILNYGQNGLEQTQNFLSQSNVLYSPLSSSKSSGPGNPTVYQINNLTFGFLAFNLLDRALIFTHDREKLSIAKIINDSAKTVDILVVSLHWGNEYDKEPSAWQKDLAHQIIDSGAKIIIGHHPHVIQPTKEYHNGLIFYSLGNFVFDQPWSEETKKGEIAKIIFEGKNVKSYKLIPVYIKDSSQPQLSVN